MKIIIAGCLVLGLTAQSLAGETVVVNAQAKWSGGSWRFDVTLRHDDTGWEHYADAWRVVGPDGTVYGTRTLYHPHVDEQPFTRSLSGVTIPNGVNQVVIEARDSLHGWSSSKISIDLKR